MVSLLAAVVAYAGSYLFSPSYSATTKVLVRAREARFLTSSGQDLSRQPGVIDSSLAKSLGQTNAGLVTSRDVAERVVHDLGLDRARAEDTSILGSIRSAMKKTYNVVKALVAHGFYTEPSSPVEAAVMDVQNQLQAAPIKDSYLIEIKASADNPKLAAGIADAAAAAIVSVNKDRFEKDANTYRDFLRAQVDRARADVMAADEAIRVYKDANGITLVSEQLRLSASSQEAIRQALRQTEVDLDGATARQSAIERSLSNVSSTESTTTTVQSGRSATTTTAVAPNKLYQDLQRDLSSVKAEIASLKAKRETLAAALITPANNPGVLPTQEAKLNELELTLSTRQAAYRSVRQSYDEAILNSAQGADEVSQVDHATVPLYPDRPVRWIFALLGLVLGVAGAIGLAHLLDRRGRRAVVSGDRPLTQMPVPTRAQAPLAEHALLSRIQERRQ
jgi:uncharacterized protein involved in exopolysaccharide biosynthesis